MDSPDMVQETLDKTLETMTPSVNMVLVPIFVIAFLIFVGVSLVLLYHWKRYSLHNKRIAFAETAYFVVSIIAIAVALFALFFA